LPCDNTCTRLRIAVRLSGRCSRSHRQRSVRPAQMCVPRHHVARRGKNGVRDMAVAGAGAHFLRCSFAAMPRSCLDQCGLVHGVGHASPQWATAGRTVRATAMLGAYGCVEERSRVRAGSQERTDILPVGFCHGGRLLIRIAVRERSTATHRKTPPPQAWRSTQHRRSVLRRPQEAPIEGALAWHGFGGNASGLGRSKRHERRTACRGRCPRRRANPRRPAPGSLWD
jgi:hypothetical protein